jgi:hypothetical protein
MYTPAVVVVDMHGELIPTRQPERAASMPTNRHVYLIPSVPCVRRRSREPSRATTYTSSRRRLAPGAEDAVVLEKISVFRGGATAPSARSAFVVWLSRLKIKRL